MSNDKLKDAFYNFLSNKKPINLLGTNSKDDDKKVNKAIKKGRPINIDKPSSTRTAYTNKDKLYSQKMDTEIGDNVKNRRKQGHKATKYQVASSAIKSISYDGKENCKVTFNNGSKEYNYKMTPEEFKAFYDAQSKGRHVNEVMKYKNHDSNF